MRTALIIFLATLAASMRAEETAPSSGRWVVWSGEPAALWEDAFVTGNGRHGAMVMGQPGDERIVCVHEELFIRSWDREKVAVADIAGLLPEVRRLVEAGKTDAAAKRADAEARRQLAAMGAPHASPLSPHPAFDLRITTGTYSSIYIAGAIVLWWHKGQRPTLGSGATTQVEGQPAPAPGRA